MKRKVKNFFKKQICKNEQSEIEKLKKELKSLKKENKKLKIQNSFKDDIISAVSHEFKNPISIINGYIETILNSNLPYEIQKKFLSKIHKNTLRLSELIDRLYLITKIENKKLKINKENFRLDKAVKEVVESFDEKRIKLNLIPVSVKADKNLIQIVIYNLISNALKYSKSEIKVNLNDKYFEVVDNGIGIDKQHIELIKEKFFRIAKNDWDNSLGLGLYIVEKILKMHHTNLEIESEIKKGSRFYFNISTLTEDKEFQPQ